MFEVQNQHLPRTRTSNQILIITLCINRVCKSPSQPKNHLSSDWILDLGFMNNIPSLDIIRVKLGWVRQLNRG